jgi:hypothetical protein
MVVIALERRVDMSKVEFEGICSGDGESFCWEVDKETYIRICGWDDDSSPYKCIDIDFDEDLNPVMNSDIFRIYPDNIFGHSNEVKKKFCIEWED